MTTITAGSSVGLYLSSPPDTNPIVIAPGVTITGGTAGSGNAIFAYSGTWTIANAGDIAGTGTEGNGIYLGAGGTVTNQASGVIGAPGSKPSAIYITGGAGAVTNAGTINAGVWLQDGGSVTNQAGGRIVTGGTNGYGVGLKVGGTITNAGVISGHYTGIDVSHLGGTVVNQPGGTISGGFVGVAMGVVDQPTAGARTLDNQAGATISGDSGILGGSESGTVTNAGVIVGTLAGTFSGHGITLVVGAGISLGAGGIVTNLAGGSISGASHGVYISNDAGSVFTAGTVFNAGTISGNGLTGFGVGLLHGGLASNAATGTISAAGRSAVYITGAAGTVFNAGQIVAEGTTLSRGVALYAGGYLSNAATGTIDATGNGNAVRVQAAAGIIVNAGTLLSDFPARSVIALQAGGSVTNAAGGLIQSGIWNSIYGTGGAVTVANAGTIVGIGGGATHGGVQLLAVGAVTNAASASITGSGFGVYLAAGGTVSNAGTIIGNDGTAVAFGGSLSNRLVLDPGFAFTGAVEGSASAGNTLELASAAASGTVTGLGTQVVNFGAVQFDADSHWSVAGNTTGLAGAITGFAHGDTIELTGVTATGSSFSGGILTLEETGGSATLNLPDAVSLAQFVVTPVAGGTDVTVACFLAGTRIRTERGEVAVEELRVGDLACAGDGRMQARPIVWIGHRALDCRRHPVPSAVWPVRIGAGAFGPGLPSRDLWLSPDHAVFADGVLIPVRYLINGRTVVQEPRDSVRYLHVELARHAILLAEGLPCESFLDTGNRADFDNGGPVARMHPGFALRIWDTAACAPLVRDGAELAAARSWLLERAETLGHALTTDPMLHVLAGGRSLRPDRHGHRHRFRMPAMACGIALVSRSAVPAQTRHDGTDPRRLGVAVSRIAYGGTGIPLTDPRLGSGWHDVEHDGDAAWRWTDGNAGLALPGGQMLEIDVACCERYWTDDDPAPAARDPAAAAR